MIYIDTNTPKYIKAKRRFHEEMQFFIFKRIDSLENNRPRSLSSIDIDLVIRFFENDIIDRLDAILIGGVDEINNINKFYRPQIDSNNDISQAVKYVFNYDLFAKKERKDYGAYDLAKDIEINTCPYCNRSYTHTISKGQNKIVRAQFDHYFDKKRNPLLALSFYNLIPSCSICNSSLKLGLEFELHSHIHPYIDDVVDEFYFSYRYSIDSPTGVEVTLKTKDIRVEKTLEELKTNLLYNTHTSELLDLISIRNKYNDSYLRMLSDNILDEFELSQKELYRLAFGTELSSKDFQNRPLSKFKSDILKELGIVK